MVTPCPTLPSASTKMSSTTTTTATAFPSSRPPQLQAQPQTSVAAATASSPNIALLSSGSGSDSGYTTLKPQESSSLKLCTPQSLLKSTTIVLATKSSAASNNG